eukprot:MONOS_13069.1-p1 / transcript=MONOS_13069.1 / gene=MONOS_13069 / organism=Monocercomonoides_exilis_PA203 / gene_product=unspecified product / transcript_product=unspecified product / location=Mono_scaffold00774:12813-13815(+) / protein_length=203 / sequence_SO=supercontig / SO=protein_coding / is_pseudo=false
MIIEENKKKEGKNEKLLIDLCECNVTLSYDFSSELLSICVPCLLKAALNKEENEEVQTEVEMALLALSNIRDYEMKRELYLNEITEIIEHHQEYQNMTRLAYQSIWQFFVDRFFNDKSLERVIVNELHFPREAVRELEELTRNVDWKRKEEENEKRREETKEEHILRRWLHTLNNYFLRCKLWNEELAKLIDCVVQLHFCKS